MPWACVVKSSTPIMHFDDEARNISKSTSSILLKNEKYSEEKMIKIIVNLNFKDNSSFNKLT